MNSLLLYYKKIDNKNIKIGKINKLSNYSNMANNSVTSEHTDNDSTDNESNDSINTSHNSYEVMDKVTKLIFGAISIGGSEGIKTIQDFVNKTNKDVLLNYQYKYWTSPLCYSIFLREKEVALYLIDIGFDINHIDCNGNSPINYAVGSFQYKDVPKTAKRENVELYDVVKELVKRGCNIFHQNKANQNIYPVYEALINSFIKSHQLLRVKIDLIKKYIDKYPEYKDDLEKFNIFHSSQDNDLLKRFYHLIDLIHDENEKEAINYFNENTDVKQCIEHNGQNLLFYAISKNMKALVKILIFSGIDYERCAVNNSNIFNVAENLNNPKEITDMITHLLKTIQEKVNIDKEIESRKTKLKVYEENKMNINLITDQLIKEEEISNKLKNEELIKKQKNTDKKKKKAEKERLKQEKLKKEKLEKERLEYEKLKQERLEQERLEQENLEKERLAKEWIEKERLIKEKEKEEKKMKKRKREQKVVKTIFDNFFFDSELNNSFWEVVSV